MEQSPEATILPAATGSHPPSAPPQPAIPLTDLRPGLATPNENTNQASPPPPADTPTSQSSHAASTTTRGSSTSNAVPVAASPAPSTRTSATSASNPSPASSSPPAQSQPPPTRTREKKTLRTRLRAFRAPLWALAIVALLDGLALSAPFPNSPLGHISATNGILVLSILAMLTGYGLAAAAQTAWQRFRMRKLSSEQRSGQNLLIFWTLSAGIAESCLILWRGLYKLFRRNANTNSPQPQPGSQIATRGHAKAWSFWRIVSWAVVQLPGVVIMTILNPTTSYIPVHWIPITGGIGIYDPNLATPDIAPVLITNSALNILQDTRRAVGVPPFSSDCKKAGDSCKSFLLPGGLDLVAPWPYKKLNDSSLDVYVTKEGPAYQIDFWDPPENVIVTKDSCTVYAASEDGGFQLCASSYGVESGQIVAGWTPCTATVLPSGECSQNGSWGAYIFFSTILSISRRTVTVSMSRDTGTILTWKDLGVPKLQNISASDFKTAFDVMIIPWKNSSSSVLPTSSTWQLTAAIFSGIFTNLVGGANTRSLDYLRNLFATPLYVFNPVMLGSSPDPNTTQPGLPPENTITGSYARTRVHAVPARWTVLTYVAVSGALLIIIFIAIAFGLSYEGPEPSGFLFVDSLNLEWLSPDEGIQQVEQMGQAFRGVDLDDHDEILERAAKIRVKLKTEWGATTNVVGER